MALIPIDEIHAQQIQAGTLGRTKGHEFEEAITKEINEFEYPLRLGDNIAKNVLTGDPASLLLSYIGHKEGIKIITHALAISTGTLATSEDGKKWLLINGAVVKKCKSDLVITLSDDEGRNFTIGISTKQCNQKNSTNAQLYFTTARGFISLLQNNNIAVSDNALLALRQFCGDVGFRPSDNVEINIGRLVDPRRYFWEEIDIDGRHEWETILSTHQDYISKLLFQKAYLEDLFIPEYLLHKTKASLTWDQTEIAIYKIDELISLSHNYRGFTTKSYSVKKGSHKDPEGIKHQAPRFGIIQMQRGGQKQHPTQLQFNLEAGYFYKI